MHKLSKTASLALLKVPQKILKSLFITLIITI